MRILDNASKKINAFNQNPADNEPKDYHSVLLARKDSITVVGVNGQIASPHLEMIDRALRGYFMMNRGNRMGRREQFVPRLGLILSGNNLRGILAGLGNITNSSSNLEDYRSGCEELYEALSSNERGLSADNTYFCVGATKVMHMLFPEFFVMLDKNVGKTCGYSSGQYNNFQAYWRVMKICHEELSEWKSRYGSLDTLLHLDRTPSTLTRIFDKCATVMGLGLDC
jgi:hypothetical protein